ncbi:hypothetical protein GCM10011360_29990 [Primorskyibacter flagellatus]|uniref:Heme exporter protein D n=1 Tax=Primorskyibacter flagellatus TaxID=1387277 RepID=A0A917ACK2_9RHOB|nr:hypothetical protein [Primorskyibacter flagellatus]GGE40346.1 hypothetical protein GCM10011360_29990 [Primorskyibacter flagellatus]
MEQFLSNVPAWLIYAVCAGLFVIAVIATLVGTRLSRIREDKDGRTVTTLEVHGVRHLLRRRSRRPAPPPHTPAE